MRMEDYACAALSLAGFAVSFYALYVEFRLDIDNTYHPACDIASYISCSKAFRSSFAKGLGITTPVFGADHLLTQKNPMYGCISYSIMFVLQFFSNRSFWIDKLSLVLSLFMNLLSVYLFFILVYLRTICVVCVSIYIINALLLYFSLRKLRSILRARDSMTNKKKRS